MMQLTITSDALRQLKQLNTKNEPYLLLWYDTEGCGCGVNGLPMVEFTDQIEPTYSKIENDDYPTYIETQQMAFFDDKMQLSIGNGQFRLSSPKGILNPFISQQSVCAGRI